MSLKIISCLFDCFIVKAPVLHSTPAAPAQYVSNTEMSDAQLRQSDSDSVSETSLQLGIFLDLVITVTTRAEVRATTTGTVDLTLRVRVWPLSLCRAATVTTRRLVCPSLTRWWRWPGESTRSSTALWREVKDDLSSKGPSKAEKLFPCNNRNEADNLENESVEQISLFQTWHLLRPSASFSSS